MTRQIREGSENPKCRRAAHCHLILCLVEVSSGCRRLYFNYKDGESKSKGVFTCEMIAASYANLSFVSNELIEIPCHL